MIQEDRMSALLRLAAADVDAPVAPAHELLRAGRRRRQRRRAVTTSVSAAAVVALAVAAPLATQRLGTSQPSSAPHTTPAAACPGRVAPKLLPSWARAGFSDPRSRVPYIGSRDGDMVAILFAQPLTAPPSADHGNKILWVADPASTAATSGGSTAPDPALHITAALPNSTSVVTRELPGGPGPSTINLPRPGCWHLTLRWDDHVDHLDIAFASPRPPAGSDR